MSEKLINKAFLKRMNNLLKFGHRKKYEPNRQKIGYSILPHFKRFIQLPRGASWQRGSKNMYPNMTETPPQPRKHRSNLSFHHLPCKRCCTREPPPRVLFLSPKTHDGHGRVMRHYNFKVVLFLTHIFTGHF